MSALLVDIHLNTCGKTASIRRVNDKKSYGRIAHSLRNVHSVRPVSIHEKIFNAKCRVDDSNELRNIFACRFAHSHHYESSSALNFGSCGAFVPRMRATILSP